MTDMVDEAETQVDRATDQEEEDVKTEWNEMNQSEPSPSRGRVNRVSYLIASHEAEARPESVRSDSSFPSSAIVALVVQPILPVQPTTCPIHHTQYTNPLNRSRSAAVDLEYAPFAAIAGKRASLGRHYRVPMTATLNRYAFIPLSSLGSMLTVTRLIDKR